MAHRAKSATFSTVLGAALVTVVAGLPATAGAQTADDVIIEEIIVFATKVAADVQDIPVAVTAITGDAIREAGIKDVFDLQQNAPGLIVGQSQTSTTSNFSIRGIGTSSNNWGLESSVGLYVDGVYRARQSSMINDLVDVEAVEILRGPQGTLFGKNTPQGAINMRTVAPTYNETNAFVEATAGDFGLVKLSAASNISLSDNLALRGTIFSSQRDGYVDEYQGESDVFNDRDRFGARLQLAYTNNDNFDMRLIADYAEIDEVCCVALSRVDSIFAKNYLDPGSSVPGGFVPGTDFVMFGLGGTVFTGDSLDPTIAAALPLIAQGAGLPGNGTVIENTPFDAYTTLVNERPRSQNEDSGISLELNYDIGDITLTSISAYRQFDTTDFIDADFTNVPLLTRLNVAEQNSFSEEIRLSGSIGDRGSFVTGLYYFTQEIDLRTTTDGGPLLDAYVQSVEPDLPAAIAGVNQVSALSGGALPMAAVPFPVGSFADDDVQQDHDSWALFGQVDLPLGEDVTLTLGARYTDEEKDMVANYVQSAQGPPPDLDQIRTHLFYAATMNPLFNPMVLAPTWQPGWGTYLFAPLSPRPDIDVSIEDDQFSGTAKLTWFANDRSMFYVSYGTGYKSGGTNTDRINPAFSELFDAETSETIEVGMKADFPEQNLRLNIAVYDTQVDDLQANSFTGTGFNVQNAGKADTSGWELETWWNPTDTLSLQAYWVRSDAKYEDFDLGTCWDAWVFHNGQPDPNSGGDIDANICPRSGGRLAYNPEDIFYVSFNQDFLLSDSMSVYVRGEYSYYSDTLTDGDLDPFTRLDSLDLINARLGIRWENAGSELVFWGRNLGDERYYAGSFDGPVQSGRMNSYPAEPRTWGVTYRMEF